jgi:hypothetical protein
VGEPQERAGAPARVRRGGGPSAAPPVSRPMRAISSNPILPSGRRRRMRPADRCCGR